MLSDAEKEILRNANFGHLATIGPDGGPHSTPVWVDVEGDYVIVNTARGRIKTRNVEINPRVALSVYDQENPYRMISIKGLVEEVTEQGADEHIDAMAKKYLGQEQYPWRSPEEIRVILRIRPEHVASQMV